MMKRLMFLILSLAVLIGMGLATSAAIAGEGAFGEGRVMWFGYKNAQDWNGDDDDNWAETLGRFRFGYGANVGERGFYKFEVENLTVLGGNWNRNYYYDKGILNPDYLYLEELDANHNVVVHNAIVGMNDFLFTDFTAAFGRWGNLNLGRGRIIGPDCWNMYYQNRFDGFMGKYKFDAGWLALLCLKLEETGFNGLQDYTSKVYPYGDSDLRGAYLHYDANETMYFEPYVLMVTENINSLGDDDFKSNSMFVFGALFDCVMESGLHLYAEGVMESGTMNYDGGPMDPAGDLSAMAFYGGAFYTIGDSESEPYIGAEFNYASGTPYDETETLKTFQPLFGSMSDYMGRMNYVAWSNTSTIRVAGGFTPTTGLDVGVNYYLFKLAQAPAEDAEKGLGSEIDLLLDYTVQDGLSFEGGLGIFSVSEDYAVNADGDAVDSVWHAWIGTRVAFPQK
ncbi:MAG: alginate export family protein [bacterium]